MNVLGIKTRYYELNMKKKADFINFYENIAMFWNALDLDRDEVSTINLHNDTFYLTD